MGTPLWAEIMGSIFLALGVVSALVIVIDEMLLGYRQQMAVMNIVHPTTALYLGPVWVWLYFSRGRRSSVKWTEAEARRLRAEGADAAVLERKGTSVKPKDLSCWNVGNAVSHCGAGCTIGDILGEWIVFATGVTIAGATLYPELAVDFALAWTLGIAFQYFTIAPMRTDIGRGKAIWLAIRADTLSILSFQIGMAAWMILSARVLWSPPLPINSAAHWWMMQIAMIIGYATAWPVNRWLIGKRWKEKMDYRRHLANELARPNRKPVPQTTLRT